MVCTFFDKNTSEQLGAIVNKELAQELVKPVIKKFKIIRICFMFKDNFFLIMLIISYVWQMFSPNMLGLNLLKIKNFKAVLRGFIEIVKISKSRPNILWVYQGRDFYICPIQK